MATTILVCDNEEPLLALIRATLDGGGYSLIEARDGNESLELARSMRPDLILLDVMMPGRSGLEVLRELRSDPGFDETPVIMLTARAQAADCGDNGASLSCVELGNKVSRKCPAAAIFVPDGEASLPA